MFDELSHIGDYKYNSNGNFKIESTSTVYNPVSIDLTPGSYILFGFVGWNTGIATVGFRIQATFTMESAQNCVAYSFGDSRGEGGWMETNPTGFTSITTNNKAKLMVTMSITGENLFARMVSIRIK